MSKSYISSSLAFYNNKIVVEDSGSSHNGMSVMMDWEHPIMSASAAYVTTGGGDILEIGFGMGICSDYIQAEGVNSHTIVEIHPQIIEKLKIWAEDKDNVIIVEGDWNSVELSTYDGIFIDTYGDENWGKFKEFAIAKAKDGAKITYWNNFTDNRNEHDFDNLDFEEIFISPIANNYVELVDRYYMPKVEL